MIGRLEGRLQHVDPGTVLIDVGGVGYRVATTLRACQDLGDGARAALWIHTQVREDLIVLYGFPDRDELAAFEQLIAVAGVGPRIALGVLSALTPADLRRVVERGDSARLQGCPGVGRKTAERILLELKDRLGPLPAEAGDARGDAASALVNLGYTQRDATRAVDAAWAEAPGVEVGELLRLALQRLTR
jgi:Holliday junction DNA helicase RuvA